MLINISLDIKTVNELAKVFGALKPFLVDTAPEKRHADNGQADTAPQPEESALCPKHQTPVKRFVKGNRSWVAHRLSDGSWCNGK
jgi:hypothetical protein